jgi:hypothetical protein
VFAGHIRAEPALQALFAMQKVEGSNSFSRSQKGAHFAGLFMRAVGWCVCLAGCPLGTGGELAAGAPQAKPFAGIG